MEKPIDIITIVKIREGFFIGDLTAGTNLKIIEEYKITHIINATDNNYLNHFEKKRNKIFNFKLVRKFQTTIIYFK